MNRLLQLRWKLFASHIIILLVGMTMLLATARYLARSDLLLIPPPANRIVVAETTAETTTALPIAADEAFYNAIERGVLMAAITALAAAVVLSLYVSQRIVQPLQELSAISQQMAHGYYRERATVSSADELGELSRNINQLAEALDQIEQRRMALIADVAHELRTPLMTIEGYVEGITDGVIPCEPQSFALIHHETTRLKRLVADLILLSRAESGALELALQPLDLTGLIECITAQFQLICEAEDLRLCVHVADDLPLALADSDRIEQVIINLLANAVRFTPAGGRIYLGALPYDNNVQIIVRDTGIGIAPEHLSHVFERFYRIDSSRSRTHGGAGIGLTIVSHLVHAQGGKIWVESPGPGQGTTFTLVLPIASPRPVDTMAIVSGS